LAKDPKSLYLLKLEPKEMSSLLGMGWRGPVNTLCGTG